MKIVNGKLISEELSQLEELTQVTDKITRRCNTLESQVTALKKQDYTQYFQNVNQELYNVNSNFQRITQDVNNTKSYQQKVNQELSNIKSSQHKLDKKFGLLEQTISRQAKQLQFLKISIIGLIGVWLIITMNNQPQKQTENYKVSAAQIKPTSHNRTYSPPNKKPVRIHRLHRNRNHKRRCN